MEEIGPVHLGIVIIYFLFKVCTRVLDVTKNIILSKKKKKANGPLGGDGKSKKRGDQSRDLVYPVCGIFFLIEGEDFFVLHNIST